MTSPVPRPALFDMAPRVRVDAGARTRRIAAFAAFRALTALLISLVLATPELADTLLLRPARVFDGVSPQPHEGWGVLVEGDRIAATGPNLSAPAGARTIDLPGATL